MTQKLTSVLFSMLLLGVAFRSQSQKMEAYTLEQLVDSAFTKNHDITIKHWQVKERKSRLEENKIKRYPNASLDGTYQYNFVLPDLVVPAGTLGTVTTGSGGIQPLPSTDGKFRIGSKNTYSIGMSLYQPVLQQGKIATGLAIDQLDVFQQEIDIRKRKLEIQHSIERLYYNVKVLEMQKKEAVLRSELARARLSDAETAFKAGKAVSADVYSLQAEVAESEQREIQINQAIQDNKADLSFLTQIPEKSMEIADPENIDMIINHPYSNDTLSVCINPDIQNAEVSLQKTQLAIKAARQDYTPELGFIGGYTQQYGNPILPTSNPFAGIQLKWNLQNLFSNKQVIKQRLSQQKQAETVLTTQKEQLAINIEKVTRRLSQLSLLIETADKAVKYRQAAFKVLQDQKESGINVNIAWLEGKANLAKSLSDAYETRLTYLVTLAELNHLKGK